MLDFDTVAAAFKGYLEETEALSGFRVERSAFVNQDPDIAYKGWIGLYPMRAAHVGLEAGGQHARSYSGAFDLLAIVQAYDQASGEACAKLLEARIATIIDAAITRLAGPDGPLDMISAVAVKYTYDPSPGAPGSFLQGAQITISGEVQDG